MAKMVIVQHRKQQHHGSGITEHPRERTCMACREVFKSKVGLKNHQTRRSNPKCHQAGIARKRGEFVKERMILHGRRAKGLILNHESVYVKHGSKAFTADTTQICLNVYQRFLNS